MERESKGRQGLGRRTRAEEALIEAMSQDWVHQNAANIDFLSLLRTFAALFHMTEIEIAAWYLCLQETITGEIDPDRLTALLWMAAYHAKSSLCVNMDAFTELLRYEDPNFAQHTADWFLACPQFSPLTFCKVNASYLRLTSLARRTDLLKTTVETIDYLFIRESEDQSKGEMKAGLIDGREEATNQGEIAECRKPLSFPSIVKNEALKFDGTKEIDILYEDMKTEFTKCCGDSD